ncbi:MAG: hypothetical protein FWH23_05640 [Bacteroidales bacterium]|nr:hypothetical protein [Bacteroidales bacterium]
MTDNKTHSVLSELQKNLEDLSSAKVQMEEFRETSLEVVRGIDDVKVKYVEHLESIKADFKERIAELHKKLNSFLAESRDKNAKIIQEISSVAVGAINDAGEELESVARNVEIAIKEQIEVINKLLEHYKGIVEACDELIKVLKEFDFPAKLQLVIEAIKALEIKLIESQNLIIDKVAAAKEQIIQNEESKYNLLTEKIKTSEIEVKNNLKVVFYNLNGILEKRFKQIDERLERQDKEIKIQKILLFVITTIIIGGIILNFVK